MSFETCSPKFFSLGLSWWHYQWPSHGENKLLRHDVVLPRFCQLLGKTRPGFDMGLTLPWAYSGECSPQISFATCKHVTINIQKYTEYEITLDNLLNYHCQLQIICFTAVFPLFFSFFFFNRLGEMFCVTGHVMSFVREIRVSTNLNNSPQFDITPGTTVVAKSFQTPRAFR